MIICLNNDGDFHSPDLSAFNTGWLSNYHSEDEYLFMNGFQWIKIEGIRDIKSRQNYKVLFKALWNWI